MKRILLLIIYDLKNILRDPSIAVMFIVPVILVTIFKIGVPMLITHFPVVENYTPEIVAVFCGMMALVPAFLLSFLIIEEKEQGIFSIVKVLPINTLTYVLLKLIVTFVLNILTGILIFTIIDIEISFLRIILLIILLSLISPMVVITIAVIAKNKLEAFSFIKAINILFLVPIAAFFISSPLKHLIGISPIHWVYQSILSGLSCKSDFGIMYSIALVYQIAILLILIKQFYKQIIRN